MDLSNLSHAILCTDIGSAMREETWRIRTDTMTGVAWSLKASTVGIIMNVVVEV